MPEPEPRLDPLTRLAIRYGTDKFGPHLYTPIYHRLLNPLREQPVRLLEIGVGGYRDPHSGGSSLAMWAEYFPYGRIVGLDIAPKFLELPPRITIVQGSQDDTALLQRLHAEHGPFDIVIDDGSHVPQHMITSFLTLYPLLSPEGMYFVEDTQTCFAPDTAGSTRANNTIYSLAFLLSLQMHRLEGYTRSPEEADLLPLADITAGVTLMRNIVHFQRGDNSYPANAAISFSNPRVAETYGLLERESALNPAPRNVLSRMEICGLAGEFNRAAELAVSAMRAYPHDLSLMRAMLHFMTRMKRVETAAVLVARIKVLEKQADF